MEKIIQKNKIITKNESLKNKNDNFDEKLNKVLVKRALGYSCKEVIEEYNEDKGNLKLVKKKVTKKNIPPDINAVKILLEQSNDSEFNLNHLSDEELLQMREELLLDVLPDGVDTSFLDENPFDDKYN